MKKYLFSLLFLAMAFSSATLHAQAPRAVTQQAVVRDAAGHLRSGRAITLRVSIMQGSPVASPIFVETHSATTNANGLYTILVGQGTAVSGTFAAIDWGSGPFYASTDIDPDGGTNYSITTTQQFLSVPFALFADTAAHVALASVAASATTAQHATLSDTARYYQERQVLTLGHDTVYLTGGSYIVLPSSGNANISNTYIDSVIRANNTTVVNNYVDSVVRANNTVVQNQISDSVRQMQNVVNNNITTLLRDSITTLLRDSIVTIIRDSSTVIQQNISTIPAGACYATCGRVDSLIRRLDSTIHVYDSTIHVYDSTIHVYDSLSRRLAHRIDSVDSVSTANPCLGHSYAGSISHTACDSYTWPANGQTYTASTTASKTFAGGSAAGCDSTVTLHLTINHGTHNAETQSATTSYTWHGNTYTASGIYVYTYTNASGCPSADTLHLTISSGSVVITDGALPGTFSVSSNTSVKFSQGNLQYRASTNTWRFAEHQYDYIGNASGNTTATASRATQSAWIDLFGWGTSGYHDPADYYNQRYQPWETASSTVDETYNYYGYGPSTNQASRNLTGTSAHYDWGVHNAISNGGNVAGRWRTLTSSEWNYLLNTRTTTGVIRGTSNARYCKATVNGKAGMIVFPDNYTHPTGIPIPNNTNSSNAGYSDTFTESEWSRMEAAGCVFLPAAGYRVGTTVNNAGSGGYYWSSTYISSNSAHTLGFFSSVMYAQCNNFRYFGMSVRLVQGL